MIYTALTASGLLFWGLVALVIVLNARMLTLENEVGAVAVTVLALIGTVMFTDAEFDLFWVAILVPVYFGVGIAWAIYKWNAFLDADIAKQKAAYAEYAAKPLAGNQLHKSFKDYATRQTASQNADRITGWLALWPFSMSYVVLQFPWRFVQFLWRQVSTTFERIASRKYDVNGA